MVIYGVALLSFCMLVGVFAGDVLGELIGVQANVGGVGIAMLLLLFLSNLSSHKFRLNPITETGIGFWSAMYIPIVVAMAAKQNVIAAISSGWMDIMPSAIPSSRSRWLRARPGIRLQRLSGTWTSERRSVTSISCPKTSGRRRIRFRLISDAWR